jgi:hypothetical protein
MYQKYFDNEMETKNKIITNRLFLNRGEKLRDHNTTEVLKKLSGQPGDEIE